jgi:tyrosyl-tRNA synthetase
MAFLKDLQDRELVHQCTDTPGLTKALDQGPITAYIGFDPTAESLHVGSLLPVLNLIRLAQAGHKPLALVGGATGMIGDPSGKSQERNLLDENALQNNVRGLTTQLQQLFKNAGVAGKVQVCNNWDWFKEFSFIGFLRDVGKHFTVNMMMGKESVRARLEDREHGISYTEFSYMLLQAYDFWHLYRHNGCTLQMGGSDQWGNITAGTDLIRRMNHALSAENQLKKSEAFGLTFPLVTKTDGSKFGKSEKGNVWLAANRTSPYEFYQFFMRTEDADVVRYLKIFTFLPLSEINALEQATRSAPEKRAAQKRLAEEVTKLVHGPAEAAKATQASEALFGGGDVTQLTADQLAASLADAPKSVRARADLSGDGLGLVDLLAATGLCQSKGAARKDIAGGGINVNDERVTDANARLTTGDLIDDKLIILRKGKKNYHLVTFE